METVYSIHPAIGIARVGNSDINDNEGNPAPESYFIGQEVPGFGFEPQPNSDSPNASKYRDSQQKLRRQAVRFRLYEQELDDFGNLINIREIDSTMATITWTVAVANKKAVAERFPPYNTDWDGLGNIRNHDEPDRSKLIIVPAPEDITLGQKAKELTGKFLGKEVKLANVLTDQQGRLIFLGGHGKIYGSNNAQLGKPDLSRHQIYNHDQICDDTCDGWITAKVEFNEAGGQIIHVDGINQRARVIVAPPNFAPPVQSTITLYDVVHQANLVHRPHLAIPDADSVSFTRDIFPFLNRVVSQQYVSKEARWGHGDNKKGDFLKESIFKTLSSKAKSHQQARTRVVELLTRAGAADDEIKMPKLYGGVNPHNPTQKPQKEARDDPTRLDSFGIPLVITPYQRKVLNLWAEGRFVEDWPGNQPPYIALDKLKVEDQPDALDRAGLEDCSGGSFHPGIEGPYLMARSDTYVKWFRIALAFEPGDLTKGMSVPWHTDFRGCSQYWWPAQRPNSVPVGENQYKDWWRNVTSYAEILDLGIVSNEDGVIQERERQI